ncbi:MAG TPA: TetR/AcrR family transcriptional regulator [Spirochaetia bacterium]|nr:TetR/AcrR family transcriptional regulator [Spirochaetia bacterium]
MTRRLHHTRQGEAQKQRLVDAAYDIIAHEGFEGLRTREVALRANLNISTLHYYFASKEDLVRSVAERLLSEFKAAPEPRGTSPGAMEKLHTSLADQDELIRRHPATYVVVNELFTRSLRDAKLRPVVQELLGQWERHFHSFISEGMRSGEIDPRSDALVTTRTLQCLMLGRTLLLLVKGEDLPRDAMFRQVSRWLSPRGRKTG